MPHLPAAVEVAGENQGAVCGGAAVKIAFRRRSPSGAEIEGEITPSGAEIEGEIKREREGGREGEGERGG